MLISAVLRSKGHEVVRVHREDGVADAVCKLAESALAPSSRIDR